MSNTRRTDLQWWLLRPEVRVEAPSFDDALTWVRERLQIDVEEWNCDIPDTLSPIPVTNEQVKVDGNFLQVAVNGLMELDRRLPKGWDEGRARGVINVQLFIEGHQVSFTKIVTHLFDRLEASLEQRAADKAFEMLREVQLEGIADALNKAEWMVKDILQKRFPHLKFEGGNHS